MKTKNLENVTSRSWPLRGLGGTTEANGTRERPILFSGPMVKAILEGRKTQTRRVVNPQPWDSACFGTRPIWGQGRPRCLGGEVYAIHARFGSDDKWLKSPYGGPGDRLWVRETFALLDDLKTKDPGVYALQLGAFYRSEHPTGLSHDDGSDLTWRPSIFMPRWASRLTLEITNVRVERLSSITEADAIAEGVDSVSMADVPRQATMSRRADFKQLWDKINAKRGYSWTSDPWVWVIEFKPDTNNALRVNDRDV